jgi:cytochrome c-type biogenesis protein CcmH
MKKLFLILLISIFSSNLLAIDTIIEQREIKLYRQIRCMVCNGQSIAESDTQFAVNLKQEISKQLKQGKSDKEILQYITDKFGDYAILSTNFNKKTAAIWIFPLIAVIAGILIIIRKYRK